VKDKGERLLEEMKKALAALSIRSILGATNKVKAQAALLDMHSEYACGKPVRIP
jgi:hypothetical protein